MRLLVLTNFYPPLTLGGYELLCQQHVDWLNARGHDVLVVTSSYGVNDDHREPGVVRLLDLRWRDFQHDRPGGWDLLAGERRQRRLLQRLIRDHRPEAAVVWGMAAISKSLLAVIREEGLTVTAVVGEEWPIWDVDSDPWMAFWASHFGRRLRPLGGPLRRLAASAVAPVDVSQALAEIAPVYASEDLLTHIEAARPEWRGRGRVVANGISAAMFSDREPGEAIGIPIRLLYAGRVEPRKGVITAVEALAELASRGIPAVLTIIGWRHPDYARDLEEAASDLDVAGSVEWREPVPREEMPSVYREHDALVFPTLWREPFGLVPLEAMAAGCVVIATGSGGSAEFLEAGVNSLRFPPGDAAALAAQVAELVSDAMLMRKLRVNGVETARRHGFEEFALAIEATLTGPRPAA